MDCGNFWDLAGDELSAECEHGQDVLCPPGELQTQLSPFGFAQSSFGMRELQFGSPWVLWQLGGGETSPAQGQNPPKHLPKLDFYK